MNNDFIGKISTFVHIFKEKTNSAKKVNGRENIFKSFYNYLRNLLKLYRMFPQNIMIFQIKRIYVCLCALIWWLVLWHVNLC